MTQIEQSNKISELQSQLEEAQKIIADLQNKIKILEEAQVEEESNIWKPKKNDEYSFITNTGSILTTIWLDTTVDINRFITNNVFKTIQDAEFEIEKRKVFMDLKKFSESENHKWNDSNLHYFLYYSNDQNGYIGIDYDVCEHKGGIYFESEEKASNAIDAIGTDRLKKYFFEIKD